MKYKVGDLVLLKHCEYKPRPPWKRRHELPQSDLYNSHGIITKVEKYIDIFVNPSELLNHPTESDNGYIWLSHVDGIEYYLFEDEITGEVVK